MEDNAENFLIGDISINNKTVGHLILNQDEEDGYFEIKRDAPLIIEGVDVYEGKFKDKCKASQFGVSYNEDSKTLDIYYNPTLENYISQRNVYRDSSLEIRFDDKYILEEKNE